MEKNKITVGVEVTEVDGRFQFNILAEESLDMESIRSILAGGLTLTILSEKTPKDQGRVLREVIEYLESELISLDSFDDIRVNPKHDKQ
jgi:hypothetical protein